MPVSLSLSAYGTKIACFRGSSKGSGVHAFNPARPALFGVHGAYSGESSVGLRTS